MALLADAISAACRMTGAGELRDQLQQPGALFCLHNFFLFFAYDGKGEWEVEVEVEAELLDQAVVHLLQEAGQHSQQPVQPQLQQLELCCECAPDYGGIWWKEQQVTILIW
jgi:hypothetical protein